MRWLFSFKNDSHWEINKGCCFWNSQAGDTASPSFAVTFAWEPSTGLDPHCWLRLITASTSVWDSMMEESAPDVLLGQEDSSLIIDLCASLPSGGWHQNQGKFILGLHLAHGPPQLANPVFGSHLAHLLMLLTNTCFFSVPKQWDSKVTVLEGGTWRWLRRMWGSGNQLRKEPCWAVFLLFI